MSPGSRPNPSRRLEADVREFWEQHGSGVCWEVVQKKLIQLIQEKRQVNEL